MKKIITIAISFLIMGILSSCASTPNETTSLTNVSATTTQPLTDPTKQETDPTGVSGKIVFTSDRDGNAEIYIMNVDGSDQTRLTFTEDIDEAWPSISPDGKRIVFCTDFGQYKASPIGIMDNDGTDRINFSVKGSTPVFSANSEVVFYGSSDGVYSINIDGTGSKNLVEAKNATRFALSQDGSQIAYLAETEERDWNLFMMKNDGSENHQIANLEAGTGENRTGLAGDFDFSPDGDKLVFQSRQDSTVTYPESGIYVIFLDDSDPFQITDTHHLLSTKKFAYFIPSFSQDGSTLFYASKLGQRGEYSINSMTVEGLDQKAIASVVEDVTGKQRVDMSPDGETLVFASMDEGDYQLFTVGTDGTGLTQLTDTGNNYQPFYSPPLY